MQTSIRAHLLRLTTNVAVIALVALFPAHAQRAQAQELDAALEEQALAIEKLLLCPQCTNKRVDVCDLEICDDMRRIIRTQLAAGTAPDDVVEYFKERYGVRILAVLPPEGFNLVLFGWVGMAVLLVGAGGGLFLMQLKRSSAAARAGPGGYVGDRSGDDPDDPAGDAWLDAQLAAEREDDGGEGGT